MPICPLHGILSGFSLNRYVNSTNKQDLIIFFKGQKAEWVEEGMGLEDIVRGVATIKIHCLKLEEAQLRESTGGTRIAKHAIFFKGRKPFHPEG